MNSDLRNMNSRLGGCDLLYIQNTVTCEEEAKMLVVSNVWVLKSKQR